MIGLTGGIGSGKSTVAETFAQLGVAVIDTDRFARNLTAPDGEAMVAIRTRFGATVVADDGSLNRDAMRSLAFSDKTARDDLERILHPLIRARCEQAVAASTNPYLILEVPLLLERGNLLPLVSRLAVVDCQPDTQISRVRERSNLTERDVRAIMATQVDRATRLAAAHDVIGNDGDRHALTPIVTRLHATYLYLARFARRTVLAHNLKNMMPAS